MEIRTFRMDDLEVMVSLWERAGLLSLTNDPIRDIERKLEDSPWGLLVMDDEGVVIGSVMVGYDGHRGWINYLACDPAHRRRGVATALMTAARERLTERGCLKINLQVREGNDSAIAFYESLGFSNDRVTSFGLRLIIEHE
jgi:ribosomal protein S18 acetylase RimI-like enzyme